MENCTTTEGSIKIGPCWLQPPPKEKRCGAKTRSGKPCMKWAMKGKSRCKNHGGLSTGPKTAEGIEAIRKANTKHGRYGIDKQKRRLFNKIISRLDYEASGSPGKDRIEGLYDHIQSMTVREFKVYRKKILKFIAKTEQSKNKT